MEDGDGRLSSVVPIPVEQGLFYDVKFLAREFGIFKRAKRELQTGLDLNKSEGLSLEQIRARTAVDSAVLELDYPQLTLLPQMPSLFRYLRAEELGGSLKRGGDILLVGSGTTLYEAIAVTITAPSREQSEIVAVEFREKINSFHPRRNNNSNELSSETSPALLQHSIVAIEPDTRQIERFDEVNKMFGTKTKIINETLQAAILDLEDCSFDNVILNRLDPRIFESNPELLRKLIGFVRSGGSMVVTVGTGNNELERQQRVDFIRRMSNEFSESGMTDSSRMPSSFEGKYKNLFGPDLIGGIVGKKQ